MNASIGILAVVVVLTVAVLAAMYTSGTISAQTAQNVENSYEYQEKDVKEKSNVRLAEQIPSSCTATQNCGQPTCEAVRGGGCGCGG